MALAAIWARKTRRLGLLPLFKNIALVHKSIVADWLPQVTQIIEAENARIVAVGEVEI